MKAKSSLHFVLFAVLKRNLKLEISTHATVKERK